MVRVGVGCPDPCRGHRDLACVAWIVRSGAGDHHLVQGGRRPDAGPDQDPTSQRRSRHRGIDGTDPGHVARVGSRAHDAKCGQLPHGEDALRDHCPSRGSGRYLRAVDAGLGFLHRDVSGRGRQRAAARVHRPRRAADSPARYTGTLFRPGRRRPGVSDSRLRDFLSGLERR